MYFVGSILSDSYDMRRRKSSCLLPRKNKKSRGSVGTANCCVWLLQHIASCLARHRCYGYAPLPYSTRANLAVQQVTLLALSDVTNMPTWGRTKNESWIFPFTKTPSKVAWTLRSTQLLNHVSRTPCLPSFLFTVATTLPTHARRTSPIWNRTMAHLLRGSNIR